MHHDHRRLDWERDPGVMNGDEGEDKKAAVGAGGGAPHQPSDSGAAHGARGIPPHFYGMLGAHVFEAGAAGWNAYAKFAKKASNAAYPQVPAAVVIAREFLDLSTLASLTAVDGAFNAAGLALDPDSWKRPYYLH